MATFSGPYEDISGTPTERGAHLAVQDAGPITIGGQAYTVTLVKRDFPDRADAAASAARALINQDRVVAIIGPQFSRHAIAVGLVAEDAHIPMISPMSSNPATTKDRHYVFRLAFLDDVQGLVLARFARDDLHARTAAVLYEISSSYSKDLAERFRDAFTGGGGRVGAFEAYTADAAQDFGPELRRIAAARPDVLVLPNFPDAVVRQVPQVQRAGIRARLLGGDTWDPQTLPGLLKGQKAYVTNQWRPDIPLPEAKRFVEHYRDTYHSEPRATAAMTYDAVAILLDAVRKAGLDPDAIRDAIAATRDHAGASGVVTFAGSPDPRRAVAVSDIRNNTLQTVRLVEPQ